MENLTFPYQPACLVRDCSQVAVYKIAAPWSDGTRSELKNYGTACEAHAPELLQSAQCKRASLHLAEGETVGVVSLFRLESGRRDAELKPMEN